MWFDDLMDDCKQALAMVTANVWISLPYVLHTLISGIGTIVLVVGITFMVVFTLGTSSGPDQESWVLFALVLLGIIVITGLLSSALTALAEAGSINLFAAVAAGETPSAAVFWGGVRKHFLSMWGMMLFLSILALLLSPVLAVLLVLALAAGILSAGWALLAVAALGTVFLGAWPVALVLDRQGGFKALAAGLRLGRRYFWGMFILALAASLLGQHLSMAFGPLVALLAGWILAAVIRSWFKMAILLIYKRRGHLAQ